MTLVRLLECYSWYNMKPQIKLSSIQFKSVGKRVTVIAPANIYDAEVEDEVFIGPFCEIQSNVTVGHSTRIQSHSFICSNVSIGQNCFIGHGVVFINDKFSIGHPAGGNKDLWMQTLIRDRVYIGSNSTILPVEICSDVVIGAGSVVTKDILVSGVYAGNPCKKIRGLQNDF